MDLSKLSPHTTWTTQQRQNERYAVSSHNRLLNSLFRRRSKESAKLRVSGLCEVTGEFPAQRANNEENVSIWWRHYEPVYVSSVDVRSQIAILYVQYTFKYRVDIYFPRK